MTINLICKNCVIYYYYSWAWAWAWVYTHCDRLRSVCCGFTSCTQCIHGAFVPQTMSLLFTICVCLLPEAATEDVKNYGKRMRRKSVLPCTMYWTNETGGTVVVELRNVVTVEFRYVMVLRCLLLLLLAGREKSLNAILESVSRVWRFYLLKLFGFISARPRKKKYLRKKREVCTNKCVRALAPALPSYDAPAPDSVYKSMKLDFFYISYCLFDSACSRYDPPIEFKLIIWIVWSVEYFIFFFKPTENIFPAFGIIGLYFFFFSTLRTDTIIIIWNLK